MMMLVNGDDVDDGDEDHDADDFSCLVFFFFFFFCCYQIYIVNENTSYGRGGVGGREGGGGGISKTSKVILHGCLIYQEHSCLQRRAHPEEHWSYQRTWTPFDLRPDGIGKCALAGQQAADLRLAGVSVGRQLQDYLFRYCGCQGA